MLFVAIGASSKVSLAWNLAGILPRAMIRVGCKDGCYSGCSGCFLTPAATRGCSRCRCHTTVWTTVRKQGIYPGSALLCSRLLARFDWLDLVRLIRRFWVRNPLLMSVIFQYFQPRTEHILDAMLAKGATHDIFVAKD